MSNPTFTSESIATILSTNNHSLSVEEAKQCSLAHGQMEVTVSDSQQSPEQLGSDRYELYHPKVAVGWPYFDASKMQVAPAEHQLLPRKVIETLECSFCSELLSQPRTLACCGITLCLGCLPRDEEVDDNDFLIQCPHCFEHTTIPEKKTALVNKLLDEVVVKCIHESCTTMLPLHKITQHHICDAARVSCPNSGCSYTGTIQEYEFHVICCPNRRFTCKKCLVIVSNDSLTLHTRTCSANAVACPHLGCTFSSSSSDMATHRVLCLFKNLTCAGSQDGCSVRCIRAEMIKHESTCVFAFNAFKHRLSLSRRGSTVSHVSRSRHHPY